MTFLPEDDVEFLRRKAIAYELKSKTPPDGTVRNDIISPAFNLPAIVLLARATGL